MKTCKLCNKTFSIKKNIDGKIRNLANRKYCLECSPFGTHNTKILLLNQNTDERRCPRCKVTKQTSEFYKRRKNDSCTPYCKDCTNNQTIERQRRLKAQAVEYLGGKCVDCGYDKHPSAFDFHHLEQEDKKFAIGMAKLTSFNKIKEELNKCILLCSNCHRIRHAKY